MLPLNDNALNAAASYICTISDASNMVLTVTLPAEDDARRLMATYGDAAQRDVAVALLGLTDCGNDFATVWSECAADLPPLVGAVGS